MDTFQTFRPQTTTAVVAAHRPRDVVDAVRRATAESRPLAVQATGHGVGVVDPDALLVDTSAMRGVSVDAVRRTARIEAGARWSDVVPLAAEHGLAPLTGSTSHVGAVGYLLGGGLPILGREHGWAAERVRSFEVVTADGEERVATDDEVGWALRGGGGSFGVVTAVTVDLLPLETVYGGSVYFPADEDAGLLRRWRDWAADLPDSVSTSVAIVPIPDVDGPPPPIRGRRVVAVRLTCTDLVEGPRRGEEVRALGEVLLDGLGELPWTQSDRIHGDPTTPAPTISTHVVTSGLSDALLEAAVAAVAAADGRARRVLEVRRLGGALRRRTGLPLHDDAEWYVGTVSILSSPDADPSHSRALDASLREALAPETVGRLLGFLGGEAADPDVVRAAYAPHVWRRLCELRREIDPTGLILAAAPIPHGR